MLEENKDVVDKAVEALVLFGKAEMRYVDPPETAEPVTERLTLEELFKRYPVISKEEREKIKTVTTDTSKLEYPLTLKDTIPNKPAGDFDLPEFLT